MRKFFVSLILVGLFAAVAEAGCKNGKCRKAAPVKRAYHRLFR